MGIPSIIAFVLALMIIADVVVVSWWLVFSLVFFDFLLLVMGFFLGFRILNRRKNRYKHGRWLD